MADTTNPTVAKREPPRHLAWQDINEPGAYVEVRTGRLYRLPQEALSRTTAPGTGAADAGEPQFVQVSKNPFIFELGARLVCARHNIQPDF